MRPRLRMVHTLTSPRYAPHFVLINSLCISLCFFSACFGTFNMNSYMSFLTSIAHSFIHTEILCATIYQQRFLSDANTKVPTQYKQPFTDAMKKLFRCMKETSTPQEEIDAVSFVFKFLFYWWCDIFSVHYFCTLCVECFKLTPSIPLLFFNCSFSPYNHRE